MSARVGTFSAWADLAAEAQGRLALSAVIAGEGVALRRAGREFAGLCPFHGERTPSFTVNDAKGFFHCFGCGAHGDAVGFLRRHRGLDFRAAVAELAVRAGLPLPEGAPRPAVRGVQGAARPPARRDEARERRAENRAETRAAAQVRALWAASVPGAGSPLEAVLRARGIDTAAIAACWGWPVPPSLRWVEAAAYWHEGRLIGRFPAMLAPIQRWHPQRSGWVTIGLHRTFLPGGADAPKAKPIDPQTGELLPRKKVLGSAAGVIRLAPPRDGWIGLSEGIETALSVMSAPLPDALTRTHLPCWSAVSLGNLAGPGAGRGRPHPTRRHEKGPQKGQGGKGGPVLLPARAPDLTRPGLDLSPAVTGVVLLEDADGDPWTAAALMERAARRFAAAGLAVERARPPAGMDFNDLLMAGRGARSAPETGSAAA